MLGYFYRGVFLSKFSVKDRAQKFLAFVTDEKSDGETDKA